MRMSGDTEVVHEVTGSNVYPGRLSHIRQKDPINGRPLALQDGPLVTSAGMHSPGHQNPGGHDARLRLSTCPDRRA